MKTISFQLKNSEKLLQLVAADGRVQSSIVRFAFNRFKEGLSKKEVYAKIGETFKSVNCHVRNSAQFEAAWLFQANKSDPNKKIYFGKFKKFQRGLISKEEFLDSRNQGIFSGGEANQKGNRFFQIDSASRKIIWKRARKEQYGLEIAEKLSCRRQTVLAKLQRLMAEKKIPVTFRLKKNQIFISYEESIVEKECRFRDLFPNRVLGIDLNPNLFGISVLKFGKDDSFKVLHKELVDLAELQKQSKSKIHFELYELNHRILRLCKTWHVSKIAVEDLKFKKSDKFWSKDLNQLCCSQFRYSFVKQHLQTLCNTFGVEFVEVNAAYSSIIGNFIYGSEQCPDPVASSIEIARRSYRKFQKGWIYPRFEISKQRLVEVLGNQWKEELELNHRSWKGLAGTIKESKLKYRFPLQPSNAVFSRSDGKSKLKLYQF